MAHEFQLRLGVQVQIQERESKGKRKRKSELHVSFCGSQHNHPLLGDGRSEQELHCGEVYSNTEGDAGQSHLGP